MPGKLNEPSDTKPALPISTARRILIVDDEPSIRFLLSRVLACAAYEVTEAIHGVAALKCLQGELPHLVVTDLMMPVMGGEELIVRLRAEPRTAVLPILVVSGNADAADEACRADAVLAKPFHPAELLATVESLLPKFRPA